jgi:hypothetical protein
MHTMAYVQRWSTNESKQKAHYKKHQKIGKEPMAVMVQSVDYTVHTTKMDRNISIPIYILNAKTREY